MSKTVCYRRAGREVKGRCASPACARASRRLAQEIQRANDGPKVL